MTTTFIKTKTYNLSYVASKKCRSICYQVPANGKKMHLQNLQQRISTQTITNCWNSEQTIITKYVPQYSILWTLILAAVFHFNSCQEK